MLNAIERVVMKGKVVIILFVVLVKNSLEESFNVTRSVEGFEKWYSSRDKFIIPDLACNRLPSTPNKSKCKEYIRDANGDGCSCKCTYTKPSFTYHDGRWLCNSDDLMKIAEGLYDQDTKSHVPNSFIVVSAAVESGRKFVFYFSLMVSHV